MTNNKYYDRNTLNSSLIRWYNKLLVKIIEEIDVVDVSKMIRQNILMELAMNKIIELLMAHPYDGEINDG